VDVAAPCLEDVARAAITDVLRDVSYVVPAGDGSVNDDTWEDCVLAVDVLQVLTGGHSGAMVLDVQVRREADRGERRIVKVGPIAEIAMEWRAYRRWLARRRSTLITPVEAVSVELRDDADGSWPEDQQAAIVYQHVGDYASLVGQPVTTLEAAVRDAMAPAGDAAAAVSVVRTLSERLVDGLWQARPSPARVLGALNWDLGVDLVVEVDRAEGERALLFGAWTASQRRCMLRSPDAVLHAGCRLDSADDDQAIVPGTMVELRGLSTESSGDDTLIARRGEVSVEVRRADGAAPTFALAPFSGCRHVTVVGRVVAVRAARWWERARRAVPLLTRTGSAISVGDVAVREPFSRIPELLTAQIEGRLTGLTHGDLNPRNVLLVGGQVFLIDFARTGERPPLSDAAWLEVCLLRNVVGPALGWERTVRLQRLLGLAARVADSVTDGASAWDGSCLVVGESAAVRCAFDVLWAVRLGAWRCHRGAAGRPDWWREYLTQLVLGAARTLKWRDGEQDEARVQAVLAAAGVAAEWLGTDQNAWPSGTLDTVAPLLLAELDPQAEDSADVLAGLLAALKRDDVPDDAWWAPFDRFRDTLVRGTYREAAYATLHDLEADHDVFISLRAFIHLRGRREHPASAFGYATPFDYPPPPFDYWPPRYDTDGDSFGTSEDPDVLDATPLVVPPVSDTRRRPGWRRVPANPASGDALDQITSEWRAVVLGEAGSGKSTAARELQYRLAKAIINTTGTVDARPVASPNRNGGADELPALVPLTLLASELGKVLAESKAASFHDVVARVLRDATGRPVPGAVLAVGAAHLTVDAFNETNAEHREAVASWIKHFGKTYPEVPIIVCQRLNGFDPNLFTFPTITLDKVAENQARKYIRSKLELTGLPDHEERATTLIGFLLDDQANVKVRELAQTPLFLWMLVEQYAKDRELPSSVGELFKRFTDWYLAERHHDREGQESRPRRFAHAQLVAALGTMAHWLVENGNTTDLPRSKAVELLAGTLDDPDALLDDIITTEMLYDDAGGAEVAVLRFRHQSFQEYFAAETLSAEVDTADAVRDRLLIFTWREPLQIMLTFSGGRPELARALVDLAIRADPKFAGKLLLWAENAPAEAIEHFLAAQERTLRSDAGVYEWGDAAQALVEYGADRARQLLRTVIEDPTVSPAARSLALDALLGMHQTTRFERIRTTLTTELTETVATLLDSDTPTDLRVTAAVAVKSARLSQLTAYLTTLITPKQPWPLIHAAWRSLESLKQVLLPEQRAQYLIACERRLEVCEQELAHVAGDAAVTLENERIELLEVLVNADRLDLVLPRRFSFEVADEFIWFSLRVDWAGGHVPPVASAAYEVLTGTHARGELLDLFAHSEDALVVVAAAHRLGEHGGSETDRVIEHVTVTSSRERLLAAAAITDFDEEDSARRGRDLVRALLQDMSPDRLEELAALLAALPQHDLETKRLFHLAAASLSDEMWSQVFTSPFASAWYARQPFDPDDYEDLMGDEEGRSYLLREFATHPFSLYAETPPSAQVSAERLAEFADHPPDSPRMITKYIVACSVFGLTRVLPHAYKVVQDPAVVGTIRPMSHSEFGVEDKSSASDILAAIGHLGKCAFDQGDQKSGAATHAFLTGYDTTGLHPTVERGRLIGLAFLGDWVGLLSALRSGDAVMQQAARNAIRLWSDGPQTPTWASGPEAVARWIATRLENTGDTLAADVRSALSEIRSGIERELGRIVLPD